MKVDLDEGQSPSRDWWPGKFCCIFDGISKESFSMGCSSMTKLFFRPSEGSNRPGSPALANRIRIKLTSDHIHRKLWELGWQVFMHPPDLVPSKHHLFLPMAKDMTGEILASRQAWESRLSNFFQIVQKEWLTYS